MADYAVQYNGVLLQSAVPKAQVTDVIVQPIPIQYTRLDLVSRNGSYLVRRKLANRKVTITVELPLDAGVGAYTANARLLRKWAESPSERPLILPDYSGKYLNCVLTNISNISIREWYKPVQLDFTAYCDPCFLSADGKSVPVGSAFSIEGDGYIEPVITHTISSTLVDPVWKLADGYTIMLHGTFASGTIVIDTQYGYVKHNNASAMMLLDPASRFCALQPGVHTITGPEGGQVTFRERWVD